MGKRVLMMLGCLLPMALVLVYANRFGVGSWLFLLICPLIHVLMMVGLLKLNKSNKDDSCH